MRRRGWLLNWGSWYRVLASLPPFKTSDAQSPDQINGWTVPTASSRAVSPGRTTCGSAGLRVEPTDPITTGTDGPSRSGPNV